MTITRDEAAPILADVERQRSEHERYLRRHSDLIKRFPRYARGPREAIARLDRIERAIFRAMAA